MNQLLVVVLAAGRTVSACGGAQKATSGQQRVPITVFAAASLNQVFSQLEPQFEAANHNADLRFNFGGSRIWRSRLHHRTAGFGAA